MIYYIFSVLDASHSYAYTIFESKVKDNQAAMDFYLMQSIEAPSFNLAAATSISFF
jgi:hypothetical protein